MSEEMKRNLAVAGACVGGVALLVAPASVITLTLGVVAGYKGQDYIRKVLEGGADK